MRPIFKVATEKDVGDNWLIASFGEDEDGHAYYVTTDRIHCSELGQFTDGAKADAEKVCRLLNEEVHKEGARLAGQGELFKNGDNH